MSARGSAPRVSGARALRRRTAAAAAATGIDVVATWVIGDVQGCYTGLCELLVEIAFDATRDELWFVGDLVNRGPDSLGVLRFVRSLGERARVTLGNHDLHLLAVAFGGHAASAKDTFADVLAAPDGVDLCHWLRVQPLAHFDAGHTALMVHAGIPHLWTAPRALELAGEVQAQMRGPKYADYFRQMYGDEPFRWHDGLTGMERLRCVTNYLTRMRWITAAGSIEFQHKGALAQAPVGYRPWYELQHPDNAALRVLFGHWAALDGRTTNARVIALDTGYVWGRRLTALRLEDGRIASVAAGARVSRAIAADTLPGSTPAGGKTAGTKTAGTKTAGRQTAGVRSGERPTRADESG